MKDVRTNRKYLCNLFCYFLISFFLFSCSSPGSDRLEKALEFAGENRSELEKVLNHYREEPEKLAAATFLIENMPRWYGYEGEALDSVYAVLQRRWNGIYPTDKEKAQWKSYPFHSLPKVYDAHVITADYLIENIELAFLVKEKYPWNQYLSFEEFCEYLLPYRIGDEPLSNWRKVYYEEFSAFLDTMYQGTDIVEACNVLVRKLKGETFKWDEQFPIPHVSALFLFYNRIGFCRDACCIPWYAMRASGIPVDIDQYVWSPEYQNRHIWSVVRDTTGRFLPFWYPTFEAKRSMEDDGRKKGKVYRSHYSVQPEKLKGITRDPHVPVLFRDRFIEDVSGNYWQNRITVPVSKSNEKYAYLGVFGPRGWIPVDIGEVKRNKVTFYNLEEKVIYQPLHSDGQVHRPAGYPFMVVDGKVHSFEPDTDQMEIIQIDRKMPLTDLHIEYMNRHIIGAKLEGANRKDFADAQFLHLFKDSLFVTHNEIEPMSNGPFRYFRYLSFDGKFEIAELTFYMDRDLKQPIPLQIMNLTPETEGKKKIIDGDILTYYGTVSNGIEFDAGEPKWLEKIVYYPRNDDNFVRRGEMFELFYQDGINGWISLGRLTPETEILYYKVPRNAVLWLRNLTKGKEEQIFLCKDGKQLFVRDIK